MIIVYGYNKKKNTNNKNNRNNTNNKNNRNNTNNKNNKNKKNPKNNKHINKNANKKSITTAAMTMVKGLDNWNMVPQGLTGRGAKSSGDKGSGLCVRA